MNRQRLQHLSVTDYIEIFWKRKWFLGTPILLSLSIAVSLCFLIKPQYRASTVVLVQMVKPGEGGSEGGRYNLSQQGALYSEVETFTKLFASRTFMEMLAGELDMDLFKQDPVVIDETIENLKSALAIEPFGVRGTLKITAYSVNPILCSRLANTATDLFVKYYKQIGSDRSNAEVDFLRGQKGLYKQRLEESEARLRKFKEENQEALSLGSDRKLAALLGPGVTTGLGKPVTRFGDYRQMLLDLGLTLEDALKKKEDLEAQLAAASEDANAAADDPIMQGLVKSMTDKSLELARLKASGSTDEHPTVIKLKRELKELESSIKERSKALEEDKDKRILHPKYQNISAELNKTKREIESLQNRVQMLRKLAKEQEGLIKSIPEKEQELENLQRDYEINSKIYTDLTSKLETASISQRLEQEEKGVIFKIIEHATAPLYPYKPNKKSLLLFGILLGAMLGIGLASFKESTDTSFTTVEDLEQTLNMPVLGNIDLMYTLREAEAAKWKHNLFIVVLAIVFLTVFFALILGAFL